MFRHLFIEKLVRFDSIFKVFLFEEKILTTTSILKFGRVADFTGC